VDGVLDASRICQIKPHPCSHDLNMIRTDAAACMLSMKVCCSAMCQHKMSKADVHNAGQGPRLDHVDLSPEDHTVDAAAAKSKTRFSTSSTLSMRHNFCVPLRLPGAIIANGALVRTVSENTKTGQIRHCGQTSPSACHGPRSQKSNPLGKIS
jgi:hypothetical protein